MSVPKERLIEAVRMLKTQQPFKGILRFLTFFGFTSKKLSVQHRIASTFTYLIFGLLFWSLIVLSIFQLNENELVNYFLIAPTVFGMPFKTLKLFISIKPIEDFFEVCDEMFSAKEFQRYFDRAIMKASLLAKVHFIGYVFLQTIATFLSAVFRKLTVPMLTIGDKEKMFWVLWILQNPGGVYSTLLFAALSFLPICLLLIVHEYVKYMNDFLKTINGSNQYEKLKVFMTIHGNFRT